MVAGVTSAMSILPLFTRSRNFASSDLFHLAVRSFNPVARGILCGYEMKVNLSLLADGDAPHTSSEGAISHEKREKKPFLCDERAFQSISASILLEFNFCF
jgi:hypothetical protein